jgi:acyl-CoA dehydrogenase
VIDYESLDGAVGHNWYRLDPELQRFVARGCPSDDRDWADAKLDALGALAGTRVAPNADRVDAHPPRLVRYDRWGNEVDTVEHHPAMLDSKQALWDCGYVSGFAADERARERSTPGVVIAGAHYLVSQADTGLVCSMGMTSGVAGLVAAYAPPDVRDRLLAGLRADNIESGIDGSMFLTERDGGSDLGRTVHCTARDLGDGRVQIDGEKWFCSNVDGEAIALLARPEGAPDGSAGLGLYLVPGHLDDGSRNHFTIRRLKDKLGTKSVPTAEVEFHGAIGFALRARHEDAAGSGAGSAADNDARGLNRMMEMVNGSRFGVAMMGLGIARRCFLESAIWAHHRRVRGRLLVDLPLVREQLVDLLVELEAAMALGFECALTSRRADGDLVRRILVPAAKARLCRFGVEAASATVELFGGNGYCEDWGLTRQLRDAQCHPIWEGSENVCVLDVLRGMRRDVAHEAVLARIDDALTIARNGVPAFAADGVDVAARARDALARRVTDVLALDRDASEARSSVLAARLTQAVCAALLLEQAVDDPRKALVALRYVRRHLVPDGEWNDHIASVAARELIAYDTLEEETAAKAAA